MQCQGDQNVLSRRVRIDARSSVFTIEQGRAIRRYSTSRMRLFVERPLVIDCYTIDRSIDYRYNVNIHEFDELHALKKTLESKVDPQLNGEAVLYLRY